MPHAITKLVYSFDELSDKAKERAREWFREGNLDHDWWEFVYEDAKQCGEILGIEIAARNQKCILTGPNPREWVDRSPAIYFSGFWSQGDGACFEGDWAWKACSKAIRDHAPEDKRLHEIADALTSIEYGEGWRATMKHRGHYYRSGCMSVDVEFSDEILGEDAELPQDKFTAGEDIIIQAMRGFADWIYKQLETEYEYQQSDEVIDESMRANEYEFDESGRLAS